MQHKKSNHLVPLLFIASVLIPVVMISFLERDTLQGTVLKYKNHALRDQIARRRDRRNYWNAIEEYKKRVNAGETGLLKPNVNDLESIRIYSNDSANVRFKADAQRTYKTAAPEVEEVEVEEDTSKRTSSLQVNELRLRDKLLLRRYSKANNCPESLKGYISGFYELCLSMTKNPTKKPRTGFITENVRVRSQNKPQYEYGTRTLNDRIRMIKEAFDRTNRRTDIKKPPESAGIPAQQ